MKDSSVQATEPCYMRSPPYVWIVLLTLRGDKDMEILFIYLNNKIKTAFNLNLYAWTYSFIMLVANQNAREEYDTIVHENKSFFPVCLIILNLIPTWTTWNNKMFMSEVWNTLNPIISITNGPRWRIVYIIITRLMSTK